MKRNLIARLVFGEQPEALDVLAAALTSDPEPVAFDTAAFQSAESFIQPTRNGRSDPRGDGEFKVIADAFCNGCELIFPLPYELDSPKPRLLKIWPDAQARKNLEFDPAAATVSELELEEAFAAAINTPVVAADAGAWLAFQFTDEIGVQYHGRGAAEPVNRVAATAQRLLADG